MIAPRRDLSIWPRLAQCSIYDAALPLQIKRMAAVGYALQSTKSPLRADFVEKGGLGLGLNGG